jgi:hypothetical protein
MREGEREGVNLEYGKAVHVKDLTDNVKNVIYFSE